MREMLRPVLRRRVLVTFVVVLVASAVFATTRHSYAFLGLGIVSGAIKVLGPPIIAAGIVALAIGYKPDRRESVLASVEKVWRTPMRRAVLAGDVSVLPPDLLGSAYDYADAWIELVPNRVGPTLLIVAGSLPLLISRDKGIDPDWLTIGAFAFVAAVWALALPRQARWLRRVTHIAEDPRRGSV